ncbi:hypothetical protein [Escherichia phage UPEC06]|nr:hypothetical protein [Escherichia phage UPEC06]WBF77936.1 hypothetical protein W70_4 [Escherichia phage W70]
MINILSLTEVIRFLKNNALGTSITYLIPQGKDYASVTRSITATASREEIKVSVSQLLIVDPSSCETIQAVKIIRK